MSGLLTTMGRETACELAKERDSLATEGTLSLQMTSILQSEGAYSELRAALTAIGKRLET